MLAKRGRGNWSAKEKKDEAQKSRPYTFRLNPAIPQEQWLIDEIDRIGKHQLRNKIVEWAVAAGDYTVPPPPPEYYALMLEEIKVLLSSVAEQVSNGISINEVHPPKAVKGKKSKLSNGTLNMLADMLRNGMNSDDE